MALPDQIDLPPPSSTGSPRLIFFIPGNPGLIAYYIDFLNHLRHLLHDNNDGPTYHITGSSLVGFQIDPSRTPEPDHVTPDKPPYSLLQVINQTKNTLLDAVKDIRAQQKTDTEQPTQVILIGHSIGAYIALEILSWWRAMRDQSFNPEFEIAATIALFPTIVDIAKSPSGRKLSPLLQLPYFPLVISNIAKLLALFHYSVLQRLVTRILSFPPHGTEVTTQFLLSPTGVRQALTMAADEMRIVGPDSWSAAFWASEAPGPEIAAAAGQALKKSNDSGRERVKTKMFFYWGEEDHWVAKETRDAVIAARAGTDGEGPWMKIDRGGVPHSFCIHDSDVVAQEVAQWIGVERS